MFAATIKLSVFTFLELRAATCYLCLQPRNDQMIVMVVFSPLQTAVNLTLLHCLTSHWARHHNYLQRADTHLVGGTEDTGLVLVYVLVWTKQLLQ